MKLSILMKNKNQVQAWEEQTHFVLQVLGSFTEDYLWRLVIISGLEAAATQAASRSQQEDNQAKKKLMSRAYCLGAIALLRGRGN